MFQFTYKLKITERIKATCERHPRYNPERDGRGGIRGGCSACFSLFDLHQASYTVAVPTTDATTGANSSTNVILNVQ
jgi:hypothetical protein